MTAAHVVWLLLAIYLLAAAAIFLARRNTSWQRGSLLLPILVALVLRGIAWLIWRTGDVWDAVGLAAVCPLVVVAVAGRRVWLVRTTRQELMVDLMVACGSIRIACEETSSNQLILRLKEGTQLVRIRTLAPGLQLLVLPKTTSGKVALLVDLLRKRYSHWWPRFSISLSGSKE